MGVGEEGQPRELTSWVIIKMKKETNVQRQRERELQKASSQWLDSSSFFFFFCKISVIGVVIF